MFLTSTLESMRLSNPRYSFKQAVLIQVELQNKFNCQHNVYVCFQCSNGYLHIMPCAPGTAFNPDINVCDHPWNVTGCSVPPPETSTPPPTVPEFDGV